LKPNVGQDAKPPQLATPGSADADALKNHLKQDQASDTPPQRSSVISCAASHARARQREGAWQLGGARRASGAPGAGLYPSNPPPLDQAVPHQAPWAAQVGCWEWGGAGGGGTWRMPLALPEAVCRPLIMTAVAVALGKGSR
jgi:hypothetical protein